MDPGDWFMVIVKANTAGAFTYAYAIANDVTRILNRESFALLKEKARAVEEKSDFKEQGCTAFIWMKKYYFENGFVHYFWSEDIGSCNQIMDMRFNLEGHVNFKIYGRANDEVTHKIILEPGGEYFLCCHSILPGKWSYSSSVDIIFMDPTVEYWSEDDDPPGKKKKKRIDFTEIEKIEKREE